jgi:hypothetical protein
VKVIVHLLHRRHDNIRRQNTGQGSPENVWWMAEFSPKTGDLTEGVNAGIGSACAHDVDALPDNSLDRFL